MDGQYTLKEETIGNEYLERAFVELGLNELSASEVAAQSSEDRTLNVLPDPEHEALSGAIMLSSQESDERRKKAEAFLCMPKIIFPND